jgi:ubiquinone/menaquinone biosynthesis C-methylase UbiE
MLANFSNPLKNIESLGVSEGSAIADFGSGVGHYVLPLLDIVGEDGHVYAIDIQKDLLGRIKNEAESKGFKNLETIWGDVEREGGSKIKSEALDYLIASNILFQLEDKKTFAKECARVLKSGGKLLFIDWSESFGGLGPTKEMVVDEDFSKKLFEGANFSLNKKVEAGAHHYGLVFVKN